MHKLIIALDNLNPEEAKDLIQNILSESSRYAERIIFKIHDLQSLIWFEGIAQLLEGSNCKLMLDPKWHDIPNTLKNYIIQLSKSGLADKVEYITLHASGWREMLQVTQDTKNECMPHVKLLAITAMTSLDDEDTSYIFDATAQYSVLKLARLAHDTGIEGIVCSTHESSAIREVFGECFDIVTPWVRFAGWDKADQKRVKTPAEAIRKWSINIVMWRPILNADDTSAAIERFFTEIEGVSYIPDYSYDFEKMLFTWDWKEILSYIWAFYFRPEGGKYVRFTSKVLSNAYINIWAIERSRCGSRGTNVKRKNFSCTCKTTLNFRIYLYRKDREQ